MAGAAEAKLPRPNTSKVIAKAWSDPAFKARLLSNPQAALVEAGVEVPAGVTVKVVEDTETTRHLILPPPPEGELSEEALEKVAGGLTIGPGEGGDVLPGDPGGGTFGGGTV